MLKTTSQTTFENQCYNHICKFVSSLFIPCTNCLSATQPSNMHTKSNVKQNDEYTNTCGFVTFHHPFYLHA